MADHLRTLPNKRSDWADHNGVAYWLGYAVHEPRDFVYCAPRRIACRLFGWHNVTCRGWRDHRHR
ncbi:hypothetical protein PYK79_10785 [Streptomyces sp. ID05-04B]|uniref:hypothetical protein n=1 Tax=Streptomyces sp. ID05-04B TaxID=3028661 RepID=UPI0029C1C2FB|nr:hypothetical protein [Streptomyces sp. ID05-04B]MDX5563738.1 hypothetical protein [Streptomyces sp. ID05-04B]